MSRLLREVEVAEMLAVSVSWLQKGRLYGYGPRFIRLQSPKGAIRYRIEDVEDFLAQMSSGSFTAVHGPKKP
jgi:hypothetical protein